MGPAENASQRSYSGHRYIFRLADTCAYWNTLPRYAEWRRRDERVLLVNGLLSPFES
jgi:hypothetical protein